MRNKKKKFKLPPIGMRIVKSATGVLLCYLVEFLRNGQGIVFYSQLAVLWCMQDYVSETKAKAKQRTIGTLIGAIYGLILLLIHSRSSKYLGVFDEYIYGLEVAVFIVIILYTTVVIEKRQASYFSCVVFLSIVVNHVTDQNPYLFVFNRLLDTMIGIGLGVLVNTFTFPRYHNNDILFVSGLDETLLSDNDNMSGYSRVELNRMIEEGAKFTISTMRTPASLMDPLKEIKLKLPLIVMDGAALYDINQKRYLREYIISPEYSGKLIDLFQRMDVSYYTNVIIDDMLVIYYQDSDNEVYNSIQEKLRTSPYRNYVKRDIDDQQSVVYFMMIDRWDAIDSLYKELLKLDCANKLKILRYPSDEYQDYWYIKIYNHNATKENMMDYLRQTVDVDRVVTFGTIDGRYTHVIEPGDTNRVVKLMKREYEPLKRLGTK